jgi:hypothetical protein
LTNPFRIHKTQVHSCICCQKQGAMNDVTRNVDPDVAAGFGHEWSTFKQGETELSSADREAIFESYFRIFPWQDLPSDPVGIDAAAAAGH